MLFVLAWAFGTKQNGEAWKTVWIFELLEVCLRGTERKARADGSQTIRGSARA